MPWGWSTYSHAVSDSPAVQDTTAESEPLSAAIKSVGAKQDGGGPQLVKISYPGYVTDPSLSNTKVIAPEGSGELIGSGIVAPVKTPFSVIVLSGPSYTVKKSQLFSILKELKVKVTISPGFSGKIVVVINSLLE